MHQVYYTPEKLKRFRLGQSAVFFRGCDREADFIHMVWGCPKIQLFWNKIGNFINKKLEFQNVLTPGVCLLGMVGELPIGTCSKLLCLLYLYARKVIALHWKGTKVPTLKQWKLPLNSLLSLYKLTFEGRQGHMIRYGAPW